MCGFLILRISTQLKEIRSAISPAVLLLLPGYEGCREVSVINARSSHSLFHFIPVLFYNRMKMTAETHTCVHTFFSPLLEINKQLNGDLCTVEISVILAFVCSNRFSSQHAKCLAERNMSLHFPLSLPSLVNAALPWSEWQVKVQLLRCYSSLERVTAVKLCRKQTFSTSWEWIPSLRFLEVRYKKWVRALNTSWSLMFSFASERMQKSVWVTF